MKKSVGKPLNWQDFESLCKKLWGEIWQIPHTIKKNGRSGQKQCGVDVYGIPKGSTEFWGIQCKGKDDYLNTQLTTKEVLREINEAKSFKPKLEKFVIVTTASKDVKIEEFVRLKSLENIREASFEILLYCWEDIVDLLEEYTNVLNWYLTGINQRKGYSINISFNDFNEQLTLHPTFVKNITKYQPTDKSHEQILSQQFKSQIRFDPFDFTACLFPRGTNKSYVDFEIVMENDGGSVIENWYITFKFVSGVTMIHKEDFPIIDKHLPFIDIDNDSKIITYNPVKDSPLIQKTNRYFKISLLPELDTAKIVVEWELIARDYNQNGNFEIFVEPKYLEKLEIVELHIDAEPEIDEEQIDYWHE
ncbi:hypothetical protein [Flavobacterium sp.]|uniref:hypothetical protein n=1 Tax=Flavobacterium sp. TaxID=239 RepID=UPI00403437F1